MSILSPPVVHILWYLPQQMPFLITLCYVICSPVLNTILTHSDWEKHSHLFIYFFPVSPLLAFLHRIRDCKSRQNVWRLCHIVKRVDVLLSTSLFTSTEQRLCAPRCFSASPFLLIPFLCTCSLNYLPRLLELSHPIIASSHRSLCS